MGEGDKDVAKLTADDWLLLVNRDANFAATWKNHDITESDLVRLRSGSDLGGGVGCSIKAEDHDSGRTQLQTHPTNDNDEPMLDFAHKSEAAAPPKSYNVYQSGADIPYSPETALEEGLKMVEAVRMKLEKFDMGSKLRQDVWRREIQSLQGQNIPPTVMVAVCGATGAGKSTILNALLDDNIVPTSGMRACTSVVTELAYHNKGNIEAEITFLLEEEWRQDLSLLLMDLFDAEGKAKRPTDLRSDAGVAWQKVHAVYPNLEVEELGKMSVEDIINFDPRVSEVLGKVKKIKADDSVAFGGEIAQYIDSKEERRGEQNDKVKKRGPESKGKEKAKEVIQEKQKETDLAETAFTLWPLITKVSIHCSAKVLSTGIVLVDLPGVADANAARNTIAKEYMKKCDCMWILAPITRAVDDKTARDLLGDAFKLQLLNGNYDDHAITFIATKTDDISPTEVIRALGLNSNSMLHGIEDHIQHLKNEISTGKITKKIADNAVKVLKTELENLSERLSEYEDHQEVVEEMCPPTIDNSSQMPSSSTTEKRKVLDQPKKNSPSKRHKKMPEEHIDKPDPVLGVVAKHDAILDANSNFQPLDLFSISTLDLKEKIKATKALIKATKREVTVAKEKKIEVADQISLLEKQLVNAQKEKIAFCSLKRSEYTKAALKEDFRAGLKELDDAMAEKEDPGNFDPADECRDYSAIDLPVFTCSSRDYMRLKGQVPGDGGPLCFSHSSDTGIPDLQEWCHKLTAASRQHAAKKFLFQLTTFTKSIQTYIEGITHPKNVSLDHKSLREKWESRDNSEEGDGVGITNQLQIKISEAVERHVKELQQKFKDDLEDKCVAGAATATDAAVKIVDEFAASMYWSTYRATIRRHGSWRRDLNVEFVHPFTLKIAHSWTILFDLDLFGTFVITIVDIIKELLQQIEESAVHEFTKDRAKRQGELCLEEASAALQDAIQVGNELLVSEQKETWRCMAPYVQEQLKESYEKMMQEKGNGSVARQKAYLSRCVDEKRLEMFKGGADMVMRRLDDAAKAVGEGIANALRELAQKVEVNLAVIWEANRDTPAQIEMCQDVLETVLQVQGQIKLWLEATEITKTLTILNSAQDNANTAEDVVMGWYF